jgi:hypothetical protein
MVWIFLNNILSPNFYNIVRSNIDRSNLICISYIYIYIYQIYGLYVVLRKESNNKRRTGLGTRWTRRGATSSRGRRSGPRHGEY